MKNPNFTQEARTGLARKLAATVRASFSASLAVSLTYAAVIGTGLFATSSVQAAEANKAKVHHPVHHIANASRATHGGAKVVKASVHPASLHRGTHRVERTKTVARAAHRRVHGVAFAQHTAPFRLHDSLQDGPMLRSSIAYVVDEGTAAPLLNRNSSSIVPIASISKLMTAMVVLDAKEPLTDTLMVTDEDRDYEKGSGSRLSVGSRLSREDMLHIALMSSENRAAAALSRYYPGGRPAFVEAMNRKAQSLGMVSTKFEDPTGLNFHNVSTAQDLVKMVEAASKYPLIRQFSTWPSYDVDTGRARLHYANTNALVHNATWEIGLQKTGFINEAGECIVMQTTIHQRPVVMVLLDSVGKYSRVADAQRVRDWLIQTGAIQRVTSADTSHSGT